MARVRKVMAKARGNATHHLYLPPSDEANRQVRNPTDLFANFTLKDIASLDRIAISTIIRFALHGKRENVLREHDVDTYTWKSRSLLGPIGHHVTRGVLLRQHPSRPRRKKTKTPLKLTQRRKAKLKRKEKQKPKEKLEWALVSPRR